MAPSFLCCVSPLAFIRIEFWLLKRHHRCFFMALSHKANSCWRSPWMLSCWIGIEIGSKHPDDWPWPLHLPIYGLGEPSFVPGQRKLDQRHILWYLHSMNQKIGLVGFGSIKKKNKQTLVEFPEPSQIICTTGKGHSCVVAFSFSLSWSWCAWALAVLASRYSFF
jgi:hypothetical protein